MLTKRQNKIISIMSQRKDWIVGRDIAKLLGVSDRTVRNDIVSINEFYKDSIIESNIRKGYRIYEAKMRQIIGNRSTQIPQTSEERQEFILKILLKSSQINTYVLAEQICVSPFSLENDINKIRKLLDYYPKLKISRQNNILRLIGEEQEKRHLYEELILFNMKGNLLNLNKIAECFPGFELLKIKDILESIFEEYQYPINERLIPPLLIHIGIILDRNLVFQFLSYEECQTVLQKTQEYQIAERFFEKLSQRFAMKVPDVEIQEFAFYLKRSVKKKFCETMENGNAEELASDLIRYIIAEIREHFDIDFSEDQEFRLGLQLHIISLLKRHYEHIEIDNTCLEEVKRKYPLIFEMGVWVCKIMEEQLKITISENEISFIALHIGSAYERANLRRKYKCILICPHNQTVINLCVQKLNNRFSDRIEIVNCMSYFEESLVLATEPDFIVTTQPLRHSLDIETVEVSMFFDCKDEEIVYKTLKRLDQIRYKNNFQFFILNLMREEFFTVNMEGDEPKEIISVMCDKLYFRGHVKEDFKEGVLKRERLSPTSFFHGFAIPHSMFHKSTNHSVISTAILKHPVKWGEYEVRLVLLLAITEENHNFLKIFFDWLNSVVADSEKFAGLLDVQDYQSFVNILLN